MILSALVLAIAAQPQLKVVETPIPGSGLVVIQAYVQAPDLGPQDAAALKVIGETLLDGTQEFTRGELLSYGAQAGVPPTVSILPDFLKVQIAVPKRGLSVAAALIESILVRPSLKPEDMEAHIQSLRERHRPAWATALDPRLLAYKDLRVPDVQNLMARLFRPDNILFSVGGDFDAGEGSAELLKAFNSWQVGRKPYVAKPMTVPQALDNGEPVSSYELQGLPISSKDADWASRILMCFALGVGKDGAVHRVFRESAGWSYRQEVILWPTLTGWLPRLIMLATPEGDRIERVDKMRAMLLDDIKNWSDQTLLRAKAMAEASLSRGLSVSPFWLDGSGPAGVDVVSQTGWAALVSLSQSPDFNRGAMMTGLSKVTLEDLKAAATEFVEKAKPRVVD